MHDLEKCLMTINLITLLNLILFSYNTRKLKV